MREGLTEIIFILDRSGSMSGLEADTIGGFNGLIEKQRREEGEALVSVVLFSDKSEVLYDRVSLDKIEPMTDRQYYVRGCTALLDAIGGAISHIGNIHKYAREEDVPEHTIVIITTDGMENASRIYSYEKVKKMISRQEKQYQWEFVFLGANIDAVSAASSIGISAGHAVQYENDGDGVRANYRTLDKAVSSVRRTRKKAGAVYSSALDGAPEWRADADEYYKAKHNKD